MKYRYIIILFLWSFVGFAQSDTIVPPKFPGGPQSYEKAIFSLLRKMSMTPSKSGQGDVYVSFLLNRKGYIDSLWLVKGVDSYRDKKTIKMLKSTAKWKAARKGKKSVYSQVNVIVGYYYDKDTRDYTLIDKSLFVKHPKAAISIEPKQINIIEYLQPYIGSGSQTKLENFYQDGVDALYESDFGLAIKNFTYALKANPKDKDSLYNRGIAYYKSGQKDMACKDWEKAIQLGDTEAAQLVSKHCKQ